MIIYDEVAALTIRQPTILSTSKGIQLSGIDNLYPQRCEEAAKRSFTLNAVLKSVRDFLNGEGFEDPNIGGLVVNTDGVIPETLNRLLKKVCVTVSDFDTICLHVAYDMNYRISALTYVPLSFLRFSLPKDGVSTSFTEIHYNTNWEESRGKNSRKKEVSIPYHVFNLDPDVIAAEIEEAGGIEFYQGQILYLSPSSWEYPTATFDAILEPAQAQHELSLFKLGYTQNGMLATLAVVFPGEFESDTDRDDFKKSIKNRTGARNANKTIGIQDKSGTKRVKDMFQSLQPENLDKLFEVTEKSSKESIIENEGWPKILVGVQNDSTLFSSQTVVDAYTYANSKTRNRRLMISEIFSLLLSNWSKPIITDAKIKEQQYITSGTPVSTETFKTEAGADGIVSEDGTGFVTPINENLKNLSPKQMQSLMRIRRLFRKEETDPNYIEEGMATSMLMQSLGIDLPTAKLYLGIIEEETKK